MIRRTYSALVLFVIIVALFVGCEEAEVFPQSRELIVINNSADVNISRIDVSAYPFGQRAVDQTGYFQFREDEPLEFAEQFSIILSPYVYRIIVTVHFYDEEDISSENTRRVTIDLPEKTTQPTTVTLIDDEEASFPYTLEVSGEFVTYYLNMLG